MKNFKLNPAATQIDCTIETSFERLEEMGWDFYDVTVRDGYEVAIKLEGTPEKINTSYYFVNQSKGITGGLEDTGDDALTFENVIELFNEESIGSNDLYDNSINDDNNFIPTFIEA